MKKKILFLAANPTHSKELALADECREIEAKIRASEHRDSFELLTQLAVRPNDLLQHLNQHSPHIVHFSGHGSASEELILLDAHGQAKPVSKAALIQLFKTLKDNIRVVVLNACFSRPQAEAITKVIDCAVGMNQAIGDVAAITFAAAFYQAIGFGRSIKVAFESGKAALLLDGIPEENTPVLLVRAGVDPDKVFLVQAGGSGTLENGLPSAIPCYLPERNRHFRGRKADLTRLSDSLRHSTTIGITQQVAVFSSGGVGKSSLALEFAWDCFAFSPSKYPGGVFWCDCRGRDVASLADGLANFAEALGIEADEHTDTLTIARQVRDRLVLGPPSLLVLDNVVDSEQWKIKEWNELLPGGNCHRLLTTRAENLGDHRIPMFRLDRLSVADARALLHAYRGDVSLEDKDDAVRAIVNWFGGLAIGLTVVGIYLGINEALSWDAYWKSLREKRLGAVRGTENLASPADYSSRVDAVIDELFRSQSQPEQQALLYASMLPGDDVSDRWLIELLTDDLAAGRISGTAPPGYQSFPHAVIAKLMLRGILVRSIDALARKTLFVHQVMRERFRELLQRNAVRRRDISDHVRKFAIRNYHRSRQWTQAIMESANFSEAQRLFASMGEADCDPDVVTFNTLLSKADTYAQAKEVFEQMEKAKCDPNVVTFNTLLSKADTYAQAKEVFEQMVTAKCDPDV
ncbi:MAG: CHAT domain-containing protein, partial [Opitutaceae bacterium]|nr:CHAT domain-containing protein [Opitutaceae bacterium]